MAGMNIHVDTLEYARDLQNAGIERAHAEAIARLQARTVADLIEHELVTKDLLRAELVILKSEILDELRGAFSGFREEMRGETSSLREEVHGETTTLREEIRNESTSLREQMRNETTALREEIRNESTANRRQMDALMLQIRALQLSSGIAAFALGAVVLLARLIR